MENPKHDDPAEKEKADREKFNSIPKIEISPVVTDTVTVPGDGDFASPDTQNHKWVEDTMDKKIKRSDP